LFGDLAHPRCAKHCSLGCYHRLASASHMRACVRFDPRVVVRLRHVYLKSSRPDRSARAALTLTQTALLLILT